MNRFRSCVTLKDFMRYSDLRHNSTAPNYIPTVSDPMPGNSWSYNNTYGAATVNDSQSDKKGGFVIPLGYLKKGDLIKVSVDFWYLNGAKPGLYIGRNLTLIDGSPQESLKFVIANGNNYFERLSLEVFVNKDAYYQVHCGTTTSEIGEFHVRNIVCEMDSRIAEVSGYRKEVKAVQVRTTAKGVFESWASHSNDKCTFSISGNELLITFDEPFSGYIGGINRPIAIVQLNGLSNYDVRVVSDGSNTGSTIKIMFYNKVDSAIVNPGNVVIYTYFSLVVFGLDILSTIQ